MFQGLTVAKAMYYLWSIQWTLCGNKYSHDEPYVLLQTKVSNGFNKTEVERNGRIFSVLIFLFFSEPWKLWSSSTHYTFIRTVCKLQVTFLHDETFLSIMVNRLIWKHFTVGDYVREATYQQNHMRHPTSWLKLSHL